MDLQQLRFLVAVSRTLNFSKAAEELFVSQPSLSYQIRRLEDELGVKLLERSTRNVSLTPVGRECVNLAQQALDLTDRIIEIAHEESRRSSRRLNIGVLAVYPQMNISSVITEFQALHLDEVVNMQFNWSTALMDRLMRKKTDIIISNIDIESLTPEKQEILDIHPFISDRLYLVISEKNRIAEKKTVTLDEALSQHLFMPGNASSPNLFFAKAVADAGLLMPEVTECQSIMNAINFIVSGSGATVLSGHVARSYIRSGIKLIPIEPEIKSVTALITRREMKDQPLVREFINFFLEHENQ